MAIPNAARRHSARAVEDPRAARRPEREAAGRFRAGYQPWMTTSRSRSQAVPSHGMNRAARRRIGGAGPAAAAARVGAGTFKGHARGRRLRGARRRTRRQPRSVADGHRRRRPRSAPREGRDRNGAGEPRVISPIRHPHEERRVPRSPQRSPIPGNRVRGRPAGSTMARGTRRARRGRGMATASVAPAPTRGLALERDRREQRDDDTGEREIGAVRASGDSTPPVTGEFLRRLLAVVRHGERRSTRVRRGYADGEPTASAGGECCDCGEAKATPPSEDGSSPAVASRRRGPDVVEKRRGAPKTPPPVPWLVPCHGR